MRFLAIRSTSGWITTLAVMMLVLFGVSTVTYKNGLQDLADESSVQLDLFVLYLRGVLGKYESLPELLARDKTLVGFLINPGGQERIDALNRYLQTINDISNASDTYLVDRDGLTIAASNWQEERPFIGRNYSYRPYFQQAMQGGLGRYFALGTTSSKRGYYFAYPVRLEREILGAVVIKIDIDSVEESWGYHDAIFLVTDTEDVIFLTTRPEWRFRTIGELSPRVLELVKKSRRYPGAEITAIPMQRVQDYQFGKVISLAHENGRSSTMLQQVRRMDEAGWDVHILTDTGRLREQIVATNVMVGIAIIASYLLLALFLQRQRRVAERKRFEERTRQALQQANEQLESRVQERTMELVETNRVLLLEIQERKNTEEALRRTRTELIQAAKMATLGQLSAGINHELNQPLAAIRSYADNARQFLEKGRSVEAVWNMAQISELTDRMAQIGIQLKEFSRKSSGKLETVPLHGAVDGALELLASTIKKHGVAIEVSIEPEHLEVSANQVLLQQVLVNILNNAIQAMEDRDQRAIVIQARCDEQRVTISVQDSGPGIAAEHQKRIFDPFFTTKKPGQGLGLGLTISKRILKEMSGDITILPSSQGALFVISLLSSSHYETAA
ncbi:ATP-binding protein [Desulfofustis limnaeus]|jgi:two-component system C4-dicarboxylate transport sensor histidine kinase DctB|uniref:histidine kinase n=1 Tax=Desulfofustis limnaeus TaxID=2740163 RepID=A0ABN6M2R9_9BACT|nr:ATP-binding protein [Desulfofustis limnaeus]MDX9895556.1 ATP-binding protein [Desulfofustis sp.]BDD87188.1 two-component sensor histidine kinase [Desulfofustis limnaeus]